MSNRDTYITTIKSAGVTQIAAVIAAESAKQTTIDASKSVVGYTLQTGNYANLAASIAAANIAKWNALLAAEQAKQASHAVARDTLRNGGGDNAAF